MHWLRGNSTAIRSDLLRAKMGNHCAESVWFEISAESVGNIVRSLEFNNEMRRILLPYTAFQTLDKTLTMAFLADALFSLTQQRVLSLLFGQPGRSPHAGWEIFEQEFEAAYKYGEL